MADDSRLSFTLSKNNVDCNEIVINNLIDKDNKLIIPFSYKNILRFDISITNTCCPSISNKDPKTGIPIVHLLGTKNMDGTYNVATPGLYDLDLIAHKVILNSDSLGLTDPTILPPTKIPFSDSIYEVCVEIDYTYELVVAGVTTTYTTSFMDCRCIWMDCSMKCKTVNIVRGMTNDILRFDLKTDILLTYDAIQYSVESGLCCNACDLLKYLTKLLSKPACAC